MLDFIKPYFSFKTLKIQYGGNFVIFCDQIGKSSSPLSTQSLGPGRALRRISNNAILILLCVLMFGSIDSNLFDYAE